MFTRYISGISQVYRRYILRNQNYISGVFQAFLRHTIGVSQVYTGCLENALIENRFKETKYKAKEQFFL